MNDKLIKGKADCLLFHNFINESHMVDGANEVAISVCQSKKHIQYNLGVADYPLSHALKTKPRKKSDTEIWKQLI